MAMAVDSSRWPWLKVFLFIMATALSCTVLYLFRLPAPAEPSESFPTPVGKWNFAKTPTGGGGGHEGTSGREVQPDRPALPWLSTSVEEELKENEDARLERILKTAAMEDNTVILTTLNAAWSAPGLIVDLFLESFRSGNGTAEFLKHLIVVALDRQAYARCKSIHAHCFALATEGVDFSGDKFFYF